MNVKSILGNTRRADISFYSSGKIDITSRIANLLGMMEGDTIDIMTSQGEFYLYISVHASDISGRHEARCYPSKQGGRHFRTYCRRLSHAILTECGNVSRVSLAAGMAVDVNGHRAIPIITRAAIHK